MARLLFALALAVIAVYAVLRREPTATAVLWPDDDEPGGGWG
jgi:hypothetical protein